MGFRNPIHRINDSHAYNGVALEETDKAPIINQLEEQNPTRSLWTPFVLRRTSIGLFLVTFVACIITLAVLYVYSDRHHGLASTDESLHYLWTYGPTAFLTLVAALWGQVDFRTRQLMPWQIMLHGPATASNTVFLDYISSWEGYVLWSSLRKRHVPVALSVFGALLIKLLIVVSTGLFALRLVTVHNFHAEFLMLDKFGGGGFRQAVVDFGPFSTIYSIHKYGSDYPLGTTSQYAYQTFNTSSSNVTTNTTLIGEIDAFHSPFTCRVLLDNVTASLQWDDGIVTKTVQVDPDTRLKITDDDIKISTPDCEVSLPRWDNAWQALFTSCDGRKSIDSEYDPEVDEMMSSSRDRDSLLLHVVITADEDDQSDFQDTQFTAVYCDVDYSIVRANLTIDNPLDPVPMLDTSNSAKHPDRKLPDVTNFDILNALRMAVQNMTMEAIPSITMPPHWQRSSHFFTVMNSSVSQPQDSNWLDAYKIKRAAELSFPPLVAQIAKLYLLHSAEDSFTGVQINSENRLIMQDLSFSLMQGCLALLFLIGVGLFLVAPRQGCPKDPGSIGSMATILAASPEANKAFEGSGGQDLQTLKGKAASTLYRSGLSSAPSGMLQFRIEVEPEQTKMGTDGVEHKIEWWRPFSSSVVAQVLIFLGPIGLVIALEILFQQSERNHGIADIGSSAYIQYTWSYIPAVTMFAVALMYNLLDFGARVFQPYSLLRRRASTAATSILNPQLGKITAKCFYDSLRQLQPATAATSLAVMLAGLLPIAASGLYTMRNIPRLTPVDVRHLDSFDFMSYGGNDIPLSRPDLILNHNMSYPRWTYQDLAFPSFVLPENNTHEPQALNTVLNVSMAAVRAKANCTALNNDNINIISKEHGVHVNLTLPERCLRPVTTYKPYEALVDFNYSYFGRMLETQTQYPDECPTLTIISGHAQKDAVSTANVLLCSPYFESVETNLVLKVPSLDIDLSHPLITIEKTAKPIASSNDYSQVVPSDSFTFSYSQIQPHDPAYRTDYDGVLSTMAYGFHGTPPPDLVGEENLPHLQAAFQHVYGVAQAQRVSWQFRQETHTPSSSSTLSAITAVLHNPDRARLVQSGISTHLLAGLLTGMVLCAAVAFFAIDTRRTLPKNPCSIAGQASLLAGSEMLGENVIPPGCEWWSDRELRRRGVFGGWMFSMGWWKGGRFGIGIGHAEQEHQ
ncbi:hypothetical protein FE257_000009 [Aspergillus nanangensis]|uniref:Uncharacterized protein n=1 Tax=Aspergillus nanangensis TaxID=2582783 RepID=A0AAD4GZI6_ASPNN|nr:hypothetical protein FE257_000009 [Aspergillus nanangensis]